MSWTVYRHITPSGKSYIGITSDKPENRWRNGIGYRKDTPFGKAIEKYGWNEIKHEILDTNLDEFTAKCLEEYYIFSYHTYVGFKDCKGYNCTTGGEGCVGLKHTEESKQRISEKLKGKHLPEETRIKISEAHKGDKNHYYGKHHTEETRRRISEAHKGKPSPNKGKHLSEDTRRRISESNKCKNKGKTSWNKGKQMNEEFKSKISASLIGNQRNKGNHHTEETKRKQSASLKGRPCPNKGKHWKLIDGKRVYY